jgi:hypothetical protein
VQAKSTIGRTFGEKIFIGQDLWSSSTTIGLCFLEAEPWRSRCRSRPNNQITINGKNLTVADNHQIMEQKSLYMAHCCEYHVRILPNNREVLQNALALQLANDVSLVEYNQSL